MLDIRFNDFYWTGDSLKWTLWDWHKTRNESNRLAINMALLDKEKQSLEKSLQIQLIDKKVPLRKSANKWKPITSYWNCTMRL